MTDYQNISSRAMLASLQIRTWAARKLDKKATDQVNDRNHADRQAGRYNKHLLAGAELHRQVILASAAARDTHYAQTLPWADEGWRLLTMANYKQYTEAMRGARDRFEIAKVRLFDSYEEICEASEKKLGSLWNPKDYPKRSELADKFSFAIEFGPVPSQGDIRVSLPAEELEEIERGIQDRVERSARLAMADAYRRLQEAVERVRRASAEDGIVRSNLIEHVRDVADILGRLNVSEDEQLEALRQRVLHELATVDVESLREDAAVREATRKKADAIFSAMGGIFGRVAA
jgi:hypothetical protein